MAIFVSTSQKKKEMASQPNVTSYSAQNHNATTLTQEVGSRKRLLRTQSLPPTKISSTPKSAPTGRKDLQQRQSSLKDPVDPDTVINDNEESQHSVVDSRESQQMTDSQLKYAMLERRWYEAVKENGPLAYLDSSQDVSSQESIHSSQETNSNKCTTH